MPSCLYHVCIESGKLEGVEFLLVGMTFLIKRLYLSIKNTLLPTLLEKYFWGTNPHFLQFLRSLSRFFCAPSSVFDKLVSKCLDFTWFHSLIDHRWRQFNRKTKKILITWGREELASSRNKDTDQPTTGLRECVACWGYKAQILNIFVGFCHLLHWQDAHSVLCIFGIEIALITYFIPTTFPPRQGGGPPSSNELATHFLLPGEEEQRFQRVLSHAKTRKMCTDSKENQKAMKKSFTYTCFDLLFKYFK